MASALEDDDDSVEPDDFWFDIPYQIVTLIARDADAVTYLARPIGADNHVALKVVGPRDDVRAILDRMRAWKTALAQVRHPHLARLLDAGPAAGGCIYVATEYAGGQLLADPARREKLTTADRRAIVLQLAGVVETLQAAKLAHGKLDVSHVKVGEHDGVQAMVIGLGTGMIVDGVGPESQRDGDALASLARELGVDA